MLFRNLTLPLATAALFGMGCLSGEVSTGTNPETDPPIDDEPIEDPGEGETDQLLFQTTVAPVLEANCNDAGCHSVMAPIFIVDDAAVYDRVLAEPALHGSWNPESARLITAMDEGHYDVVYTDDELSAVEFWIESEALNREGVPDEIVQTDFQTLAAFSGCMTLDNWNQAEMGDWARHQADGQPCASCHAGGGGGFNTNPDNLIMFDKNRRHISQSPVGFITGFFLVQPNELSGEPEVVPAYLKLETMSEGGADGSNHPHYNFGPNNAYYEKLEEFYNLTMLEMENTDCEENGFPIDE